MIWIKGFKINKSIKKYLEDQCSVHLGTQESLYLKQKKIKSWQFIGGRLICKMLVAKTLKISPKSVEICKEENGAPFILIDNKKSSRSISISHTNNFIVCALSDSCHQIGVDIEEHNDTILPKIKNLLYLNGPVTNDLILDHWVARESLVKASLGQYSVLDPFKFKTEKLGAGNFLFKTVFKNDYFITVIRRHSAYTISVGLKVSQEEFLNS